MFPPIWSHARNAFQTVLMYINEFRLVLLFEAVTKFLQEYRPCISVQMNVNAKTLSNRTQIELWMLLFCLSHIFIHNSIQSFIHTSSARALKYK